nr:CoA transferase [Leucobacter soli]
MSPLPLAGVRVLDLTHALAGPFATMILGDMGAEIIKIESPKGDLTRTTPPIYLDGTSLYFISNNRNKKSVLLDLKSEVGKAAFNDLVAAADAVIYNYSNGVARRLGIEHDDLAAINPNIITVSITGFGEEGPEADRPAVDLIAQALSGAMSITGEPGGEPVRSGVPTADIPAGMYACIGLLAGLHARRELGHGLRVDTSLFHAQLSLLNYEASLTKYTGVEIGPQGSGHTGNALAQAFRTSDGWLVIDAGFNHHFKQLCRLIGIPEAAENPRWQEREGRRQDRVELTRMVQDVLATQTTKHWHGILAPEGILCAPVNGVLDALDHPQSKAYSATRPLSFEDNTVEVLTTPLWFDKQTEHPMQDPPGLGEHTREILTTVLGYDEERVERVLREGTGKKGN